MENQNSPAWGKHPHSPDNAYEKEWIELLDRSEKYPWKGVQALIIYFNLHISIKHEGRLVGEYSPCPERERKQTTLLLGVGHGAPHFLCKVKSSI